MTGRGRRSIPDRPRRVGVFRSDFLPASETFVRDHLVGLRSWDPTAITLNRRAEGLDAPGVHVIDVSHPPAPERVRRALKQRVLRRGFDRDSALRQALRRADVDLVHAHFGPDGAMVAPAAARLALPMVVTFHGYDASMHPEALRRVPGGRLLLERWDALLEQAAGIITVSEFLRDLLIAKGADPARLRVIPCGVDTRAFEPSTLPPDGGIAFVGRLVEKKGCADLLTAVAAMSKDPPVTIIGDGPLREELEAQARELRVSATFLGTRGTREVRDALAAAVLVAMPSRRAEDGDAEGLPVVSLEASALARPVVGYRHSGLVESVLDGQTGALVDEGDVDALAQRMECLLTDRAEAGRLAANARRHVERRFDLTDCLARVEALYEDVAGDR